MLDQAAGFPGEDPASAAPFAVTHQGLVWLAMVDNANPRPLPIAEELQRAVDERRRRNV